MNFRPSDNPVDIMENTLEVATVGELVWSIVYTDLSCWWPPATNLALILSRVPSLFLLSRTKHDILIIFFLCDSLRVLFKAALNN